MAWMGPKHAQYRPENSQKGLQGIGPITATFKRLAHRLGLVHESGTHSNPNYGVLMLIAAALLLLPAVGLLGYRNYQNALFERAYRYAVPALNQVGASLSAKLKGYEDLSMQFLSNQDLNRMLRSYSISPDRYDISRYNQAFSNFLDGFAFNDACLYDALFLDESPAPRKTLTMGEAVPNNFISLFRQSESYRSVVAADGGAVWFDLQISGTGEYTLALGRRIKDVRTGRPLGVLVLLFSEKNLDYFINASLYNDDGFSRETISDDYYLLAGGDGHVISSPIKTDVGRPLVDIVGESEILRRLSSRKTRAGKFIQGVGNRQVLVTYQTIEPSRLHLLNIVSRSSAIRLNGGSMSGARNPMPVIIIIGALLIATLIAMLGRTRLPRSSKPDAGNPAAVVDGPPAETPSSPRTPDWVYTLTAREREILGLVARGMDNRQIAGQLFMAEQTVKNYVSVIYAKIGVRDRVQASLKAIEAGLAGPGKTS